MRFRPGIDEINLIILHAASCHTLSHRLLFDGYKTGSRIGQPLAPLPANLKDPMGLAIVNPADKDLKLFVTLIAGVQKCQKSSLGSFAFYYGIIDVLLMIPLEMERKELAMIGAFINRFAIGLISPNLQIGLNRILTALIVAVLLSLSAAVVTGAWGPILGFGFVGGLIIGCVDQWVSNRPQKQANRVP